MGAQAVMQKIEVTIPQEELVRVLLVDDDRSFQNRMGDFFESLNCKVEVASSPEEARTMLSRAYEMVIADVNFDTSSVKGDRFVLDNQRSFGPAKVVVLTGQGLDTIDKFKKLKRRGIDIFEKSDDDLVQNLEAMAQKKFEEREANFVKSVTDSITSTLGQKAAAATAVKMAPIPAPGFDPVAALQAELGEMLAQWLESRTHRDVSVLAFGTKVLTANEMIAEIRSNSEIGRAHIRMLVSEIKHCLGLVSEGTDEY
jgi:CheY-like chemotaxis protein